VTEAASPRILIIDDASLVRMYYREALERAGYAVGEALNGLEALERLPDSPADLLIVDVNMPQMDGFTFLRTLRRMDLPASGVPAVVISTESGEQDVAAARAVGANFYLVKPVTPETLIAHVALLCGPAG
jgi:two-component system chemotaxis response regulator CheY